MIRRLAAHVLAAVVLGWLLLGCRCPRPPVVVPPPPVVTVAPPIACDRPVRPAMPVLHVEALEDGRLATGQVVWAELVRYVLEAEARMDSDDACLAADAQ